MPFYQIKEFSADDIQQLKDWFDAASLPESLILDNGYNIPNLKYTLERIFDNIGQSLDNRNKTGDFYLLETIKHKLESLRGE